MKHLFFAALVAISLTTTAFATTKTNDRICKDLDCVVTNFKNVTITNKADFTKASVTDVGAAQEIFYSLEGDFIGISKSIGYDKLPSKAIRTISKHFLAPEYTVKACIAFVNAENNTNYYVSLDTDTQRTILEINEEGNVDIFSTKRL